MPERQPADGACGHGRAASILETGETLTMTFDLAVRIAIEVFRIDMSNSYPVSGMCWSVFVFS